MSNSIPTKSRDLVRSRDNGRCVRCGMPGNEWHHRRGRSVRDDHTHCPCNGITLCRIDHTWVHANPFYAKRDGLIVSRIKEPRLEPVTTPPRGGRMILTCSGGFLMVPTDQPMKEIE